MKIRLFIYIVFEVIVFALVHFQQVYYCRVVVSLCVEITNENVAVCIDEKYRDNHILQVNGCHSDDQIVKISRLTMAALIKNNCR